MARTTPTAMHDAITITQSRTSWGVEIGQHRMAVTRTREARVVGQSGQPAGASAVQRTGGAIWPLAIGTFASVSAFGLFVFGAVASERPASLPSRYSLTVPVPASSKAIVDDQHVRRVRKVPVAIPLPASSGQDIVQSGAPFDAADEPYASRAMRTGEFQEWLGSDGQRRFLSAGTEQAEGDRRCRELALLVRRTDGSNQTYNAHRCVTGGHATQTADTVTRWQALSPTAPELPSQSEEPKAVPQSDGPEGS